MIRHRVALIVAAALLVPLAIVGVAWTMHQNDEADAAVIAAAEREDTRAAVVRLIDDGTAARSELRDRIAAARTTVKAGRTAERGVMEALSETLSTARAHHDAPVPAAPSAGASAEELAEARTRAQDWADGLRWISGELTHNTHAAERSQQQYREARAAEREKARRAAERDTARREATTSLAGATEDLERAVRDLPPLIEDAGFTIDWSEQAGVAGELVATLRERRDAAGAALADGEAVLASGSDATGDPGRSPSAGPGARPWREIAPVVRAAEAIDAAFAALEEASWRARDAAADGTNGKLSRDRLCGAGHSPEGLRQYLTCDAAADWRRLGAEFEAEFGIPLSAEYGYRAYDLQLWAMAVYGAGQAARPGTSNHGWGEAVDLPDTEGWGFGGAYHEWLRVHGPGHGWDNPEWARQGNGREEPWHFEYTAR